MACDRSYVIDCETYQQSNICLIDLDHLLGHLLVLALLGRRAIGSSGTSQPVHSLSHSFPVNIFRRTGIVVSRRVQGGESGGSFAVFGGFGSDGKLVVDVSCGGSLDDVGRLGLGHAGYVNWIHATSRKKLWILEYRLVLSCRAGELSFVEVF